MFSKLFSKSHKTEIYIDDNTFLVDVRTKAEYQTGSVDGAINIPLDTIKSNLSVFENKSNIVIFCRSGSRSKIAIAELKSAGIQNVQNGISSKAVIDYLKRNKIDFV